MKEKINVLENRSIETVKWKQGEKTKERKIQKED